MHKWVVRLLGLVLVGYAVAALVLPANASEDPPWEGVCKSVSGTDPVWTYCDDSWWPVQELHRNHLQRGALQLHLRGNLTGC
jgi:hypothetical protein